MENISKKILIFAFILTFIFSSLPIFEINIYAISGDFPMMSNGMVIKANNELWVWGYNNHGQLGDGTELNKLIPTKSVESVKSVSAGTYHTMIIKLDGSLWGCGFNHEGQIGVGSSKAEETTPVKIMESVQSVSAGSHHNLAIKSDGSLWAWGNNEYGQLGDGTTENRNLPIKIMDNVKAVSAGSEHSIIIKTDGSLWAWGSNGSRQVNDDAENVIASPIKLLDSVLSVSAGDRHNMVIKTDGSLWTWGSNSSGQYGDGTTSYSKIPVKVMDSVLSVSSGVRETMAIKEDGSLWAWGNNDFGQLGDGTVIAKLKPIKIMESVVAIAAGGQAKAIKTDGSLWMWGGRSFDEFDDGTIANKPTPVKIMDGVMLPTANATTPTNTPAATENYIYDTTNPGANLTLPVDKLNTITDPNSAKTVVTDATSALTTDQKKSATGIDLITLFAEEAVLRASTKVVNNGGIVIDQTNIQNIQTTANTTQTETEKILNTAGITTQREMNANVAFSTQETKSVTITVDPSASSTTADNVRVDTPAYSISLSKETIAANTSESPLIITITEQTPVAFLDGTGSVLVAAGGSKTYNIAFNKPVTQNVKVSLPPTTGDPNYQTVIDSSGNAVGGKYNPVNQKLEVKVNKSGTYTVKENKKDFTDISKKSKEMQEAIKILSSKGIINGTSATEFSPDSTITRAQIAMLITKTLSKLNPNENGGFADVKSSDWYYGAAGSAKKHGIMTGTSETTFAPNVNIPKDQIIAVSARVLRIEMKYKNPTQNDTYLAKYTDKSTIPSWATADIALATQLNLVVYRTDGKFNPSGTMTRGDAAIILYRMFNKIW